MKKTLASLLSIFIPGAGFCITGRPIKFIYIQAALTATVVIFCLTRWAITPTGVMTLSAVIITTHLINPILIIQSPVQNNTLSLKNFLSSTAAITIAVTFALWLFLNKHVWLGIHVNYIPSNSMKPALMSGDVILVDTWAYQEEAPQENDIILFTLPGRDYYLVKRIVEPPKTTRHVKNQYYVMGDNRHHSIDSRNFGSIHRKWIIGKVAAKLTRAERIILKKI